MHIICIPYLQASASECQKAKRSHPPRSTGTNDDFRKKIETHTRATPPHIAPTTKSSQLFVFFVSRRETVTQARNARTCHPPTLVDVYFSISSDSGLSSAYLPPLPFRPVYRRLLLDFFRLGAQQLQEEIHGYPGAIVVACSPAALRLIGVAAAAAAVVAPGLADGEGFFFGYDLRAVGDVLEHAPGDTSKHHTNTNKHVNLGGRRASLPYKRI